MAPFVQGSTSGKDVVSTSINPVGGGRYAATVPVPPVHAVEEGGKEALCGIGQVHVYAELRWGEGHGFGRDACPKCLELVQREGQ